SPETGPPKRKRGVTNGATHQCIVTTEKSRCIEQCITLYRETLTGSVPCTDSGSGSLFVLSNNFHGFCCFARVLVGAHRTHRARRPACGRQCCRARGHGQTPRPEKAQEGALLRSVRCIRLPYVRHPAARIPCPVVVDAGTWRNIPLLR